MFESGEVMIDIDATVSCKASSNAVEIRLKREKEMLLTKDRNGNVVTLGTDIPDPFPTPHLLLNNIVRFSRHNMYRLLYSCLEDPILCDHLSNKIASEAERVPGPLNISLDVTLTPHIFLREDRVPIGEEPAEEICAICLEELYSTGQIYYSLHCYHEFHDNSICQWLSKNDTCPICRTAIEFDD